MQVLKGTLVILLMGSVGALAAGPSLELNSAPVLSPPDMRTAHTTPQISTCPPPCPPSLATTVVEKAVVPIIKAVTIGTEAAGSGIVLPALGAVGSIVYPPNVAHAPAPGDPVTK